MKIIFLLGVVLLDVTFANICGANEGNKALLKSIKVYSAGCNGCIIEGLTLTLHGLFVQCTTNNLDHSNEDDYDRGEAVFDDYLTLGLIEPDGGCLCAPLDGRLTDSEYTWTGSGSWYGTSICVEWFGDDVYCHQCAVIDGNKITDCEYCNGVTCP